MNRSAVILLLTIGLLSTACSSRQQAEQQPAPPISSPEAVPLAEQSATIGSALITVDESLKPMIEAEIAVFEALYPTARIHARYYPAEEAIREMLNNDSVRLTISSRKLTEPEYAILMQHKINPDYAPIFRDGIALLVHKDNPVRNLTYDQMLDVLSGRIKSWQEIDPNAPKGEIVAVFDHAETSTIRFLQDSIMGDRPLLSNRYAVNPTSEIFEYVKTQERGLGIAGFAWISDRDDPAMQELQEGTRILQLERPPHKEIPCAFEQTFFGPYQAFLDQGCYPLTRTIFTILREERHLVGTGFVTFLDGPKGQRVIHKAGLAAVHTMPRKVVFQPLEHAKEIKESK